jgi:chemotaxis protein MotB
MRQKQELGSETPGWIVTFADLMALMFCFFVLLTTLSTQPKNCDGLRQYLNEHKQHFSNYELRSSKLQCILSLPSDFLFQSGGDVIQPRALNAMVPLFQAIKQMDEHHDDLIIIEGHTDDVPIRTRRFMNNWELSSARASNMATFLIDRIQFPNYQISISAYADSRPKVPYLDVFGNSKTGRSLQEARQVNRRVEVILSDQPRAREETMVLFDGH